MNIKIFVRTIRNFLFSNVNKQFLVFTFFLFLSGIFWLIITLNETYEKEIKIPARVVSLPKNVVLTSLPTDTVRATIRDKGWMMMAYLKSADNRREASFAVRPGEKIRSIEEREAIRAERREQKARKQQQRKNRNKKEKETAT